MTTTPPGFEEGVSLMGALMQQSARDLAFTTNTLIDIKDATLDAREALLAEILSAIDDATVIDRKTETRLWPLMRQIEDILDMRARREAST